MPKVRSVSDPVINHRIIIVGGMPLQHGQWRAGQARPIAADEKRVGVLIQLVPLIRKWTCMTSGRLGRRCRGSDVRATLHETLPGWLEAVVARTDLGELSSSPAEATTVALLLMVTASFIALRTWLLWHFRRSLSSHNWWSLSRGDGIKA